MDDDTIPRPNALEELIRCREAFPAGQKPRLLASKVEWTDGTLHSMNFPTIRRAALDPERAVLAAQHRALSLRWATFVSVLLHRSAVAEHGLPVADYFIWNDDTEYTARVLRHQFGVLVPASVVVHKTVKKHSAFDAAPARSYYQVRNVLWMVLRSSAWASDERVKILLIHLRWITQYLRRQRFSGAAIAAVAKGVRDGLLRVPQN
jgi:GT2 family glycosyltransferase